jgi:hypothetical protein
LFGLFLQSKRFGVVGTSKPWEGIANVQSEVCSISYGNEGAPSSISDLDRYVILRNLLHSIFNILPIFIYISDVIRQGFSSVRLPALGSVMYPGS